MKLQKERASHFGDALLLSGQQQTTDLTCVSSFHSSDQSLTQCSWSFELCELRPGFSLWPLSFNT